MVSRRDIHNPGGVNLDAILHAGVVLVAASRLIRQMVLVFASLKFVERGRRRVEPRRYAFHARRSNVENVFSSLSQKKLYCLYFHCICFMLRPALWLMAHGLEAFWHGVRWWGLILLYIFRPVTPLYPARRSWAEDVLGPVFIILAGGLM